MTTIELQLQEFRLGNGLRVVVHADRAIPAVAVNLWYQVGSRDEAPGRTGLAHLFEHLMFQGSANVAATDHFRHVQRAGGTLNGTTSFDSTRYFETVPYGAFELVLWLEADRMGTLLTALTQENLDNQRDVVKNERRQRYENVPYGTATERLFRMAFPPGHPYHHLPIGSMEDLDAASIDDCISFFRTYYSPNNAVLSIVGDVDTDHVVDAANRYFGAIPAAPNPPPPVDASTTTLEAEVREVVREKVPVEAVRTLYRLPVDGTPDIEAADLAMRVLGLGSSSRLTRRLVRREQLAESAGAHVQRLVHGASAGFVAVKARRGASLQRVEKVMDEELELLATAGPTARELEKAKTQAQRAWLDSINTYAGRANELCRHAILFGDPMQINSALTRIEAVSEEDITSMASTRLVPTNRVVVSYPLQPTGSAT